jgi:hypothetical protein
MSTLRPQETWRLAGARNVARHFALGDLGPLIKAPS